MTIDAKKIILKLNVPLEDKEWKKIKNMNWRALIRETYGDIIGLIRYFTNSTTRILKSKTTEDMWKELLFKKEIPLLHQSLSGRRTVHTT